MFEVVIISKWCFNQKTNINPKNLYHIEIKYFDGYLKFHMVLNLKAIDLLCTLCFDIGSKMSNSMFVFGSLFSNKFHIANMIWVNDLRLSSFFATLTAVPVYWQQYKDFSSNVSLACDKTDNKDRISLGTFWP